MAFTYKVSYSTSQTGPFTQFGSPVSAVTDVITGLTPATNYFVQVITVDTATGLQSTPVVAGPFTTQSVITGPTESVDGTSTASTSPIIFASQSPGNPAGTTLDQWTLSGGIPQQNGTARARSGTTTPTTFSDDFNSFTLHRTWQSGDPWGPVATVSQDGRGGPNFNEFSDAWWTNPLNPNTPDPTLYSASNGVLNLGLAVTPSAQASYINSQAGKTMPNIGTLINNQNTNLQHFGYWEFRVAVPKIAGFTFQADVEDYPAYPDWSMELDLIIYTDPGGTQHVNFTIENTNITPFDITSIDATQFHTYGWNWQSDFITFYIDGVQRFQVGNPGGNYQTRSMFLYLLTASNYQGSNTDPNPASLPAFAQVDYVHVYQNKPAVTAVNDVNLLYYSNHFVYQRATATNSLGITPGWWRWSGTSWVDVASPIPAAPTITIATIASQTTNQAFTVSGTMTGYTTTPTLQYADTPSGPWVALPTGSSVTASAYSFSHPGVSSTSGMTVSVRDANNTTVLATSNTFSVTTPSSVTLTSISVASTVLAGQVGAVVGPITVNTTGGAYTGTNSIDPGGDATSFAITSNTTLQTAAALIAGNNYNITLRATMPGATGSPLISAKTITATQQVGSGFTISGPVGTPTSGKVNVNLTSQTGQTVTGALYGVAASTASGNWNSTFANSTWVNDMKNFDFKFFRQHAEEMMNQCFNGQSTTPNFSPLDAFVNNYNTAFPHAELQWTIGWLSGAWPHDGPGNFNVSWDTNSLNNLTSQCKQLAQYLKSRNINVKYWELWNEPDIQGMTNSSGTSTSTAVVQQTTAVVYPAIASVDPNYKFGSSPTSFLRNGGYINAAKNAYSALYYDAGHYYASGGDQGLGSDMNNAFDLSNQLINGNNTGRPFSLNEWNLDWNHASAGIFTADLAVFGGVFTSRAVAQGALWATGIWDGAQGGFGFQIGGYAPVVYWLSKAGQTMPGNITVSNTSDGNLTILATTAGIMVTNSATSGSVSGGIAVGGLLNTTLHKWQISNGAKQGTVSTINVSALSSESWPNQTVTIYYP